MANTYTQIHIQLIFVVKFRTGIISNFWKDELYKYITGIVSNKGHKLLIINGVKDHVHLLIGLNPSQSLSDLVKDVKASSSKWINQRKFVKTRFEWQSGYGAFSYSKSQIKKVIKYIENQEVHHKSKSFREEYTKILDSLEIQYEDKYLFKELI